MHSIYIVSTYTKDKSQFENESDFHALKELFDETKVKYKLCIGCYNGDLEESFAIFGRTERFARAIAEEYKQESYLRLEPLGKGFYQTCAIKTKGGGYFIGVFASASEKYIKDNRLSYTFDSKAGIYYTCFPILEEARKLCA